MKILNLSSKSQSSYNQKPTEVLTIKTQAHTPKWNLHEKDTLKDMASAAYRLYVASVKYP